MKHDHTDRTYEEELSGLRADVLGLGGKVGQMVSSSMRALVANDKELAREVIDSDDHVDQTEIAVDERCLQVLAKRQPMASDLRLVTTILKIVTDLERIGDMAVDISRRTLELEGRTPAGAFGILTEMAELAENMLGEALVAFVKKDARAAQGVIARDTAVDALYAQAQDKLVGAMRLDAGMLHDATRLLGVAKYLERVGDHVTNLAEMVVFMAEGLDIRHALPAP